MPTKILSISPNHISFKEKKLITEEQYTADDVLAKLRTVDGIGSGLDAETANILTTARTIALGGDLSGSTSFNGSSNVTITATIKDDSHNHIISNIDGLQTELNNKQGSLGYIPENISKKGVASGYAELDANGFVPISQLPSFVDDVLEYNTLSLFPVIGESGKIYISTSNGLTYRWSGTTYVEISKSLALGTTSATAYRGDYGNIAYTHSQATHAPTTAQPNNITNTNATALTGSGNTSLHYHTTDRARANHTGTQSADTITDGTTNKVLTTTLKTGYDGAVTSSHSHSNKTILDGVTASYTTTEKTKLSGIEAGATADMTASEILTALKTVDGSGSGLDADLLDAKNSSYFLDWTNFTNKPTSLPASGGTSSYLGNAIDIIDYNTMIPSVVAQGNVTPISAGASAKSPWSNTTSGLLFQSNSGDSFHILIFRSGGDGWAYRSYYNGVWGAWQIWSTFDGSFNSLANKPSPKITLAGDLTGSVTLASLASGTLSATVGNSATTTRLKTSRTINGVGFDGSANITITANPNAHNRNSHSDIDQSLLTTDTVQFNKIGIGTSSPNESLDIVGNIRVRDESAIKFGGVGASDIKAEIKYNKLTNSLDFNFT